MEDFAKNYGWAWRSFPTGVTIITTSQENGEVYGMTAIKSISVSLEPPLVLFALGRQLQTFQNLERHGHFGMNILAEDQVTWADYFARSPAERDPRPPGSFRYGPSGVARIEGSLAFMDCKVVGKHPVTEQTTLIVGQVEDIEVQEGFPLIFLEGEYLSVVSGPDS